MTTITSGCDLYHLLQGGFILILVDNYKCLTKVNKDHDTNYNQQKQKPSSRAVG